MKRIGEIATFVALAMGAGLLMGFLFPPADWFAALNKPFFNPPGWLFGPVWTALYLMIGIAGALVWRWDPQSGAIRSWFLQWVLNTAWTPAFFGLYQPELALAIIFLLWVTILRFIGSTWREVRWASFLFLPYLAWVSFATLLNAAIVALN